MGLLAKDHFVCLDCETTGLDPKTDRIIEVAVVSFRFGGMDEEFETLVDPGQNISEESIQIHHITDDMVQGMPTIDQVLGRVAEIVGNRVVVGHGVAFDLEILDAEARRAGLQGHLLSKRFVDTLRLARLYGQSRTNSLKELGKHFNVDTFGAHRAMNDVLTNIEVFKQLSGHFKTTEQMLARLEKPIRLKCMPLGKHKGRVFKDIPQQYLQWAAHQKFDDDLLFSIRSELSNRKKGNRFSDAANPFSEL